MFKNPLGVMGNKKRRKKKRGKREKEEREGEGKGEIPLCPCACRWKPPRVLGVLHDFERYFLEYFCSKYFIYVLGYQI